MAPRGAAGLTGRRCLCLPARDMRTRSVKAAAPVLAWHDARGRGGHAKREADGGPRRPAVGVGEDFVACASASAVLRTRAECSALGLLWTLVTCPRPARSRTSPPLRILTVLFPYLPVGPPARPDSPTGGWDGSGTGGRRQHCSRQCRHNN